MFTSPFLSKREKKLQQSSLGSYEEEGGIFCDKPQTMFLLSVGTELEENKTSDKARNSAKTALAPIAETGIKKTHVHTQTYTHTHTSQVRDRRDYL